MLQTERQIIFPCKVLIINVSTIVGWLIFPGIIDASVQVINILFPSSRPVCIISDYIRTTRALSHVQQQRPHYLLSPLFSRQWIKLEQARDPLAVEHNRNRFVLVPHFHQNQMDAFLLLLPVFSPARSLKTQAFSLICSLKIIVNDRLWCLQALPVGRAIDAPVCFDGQSIAQVAPSATPSGSTPTRKWYPSCKCSTSSIFDRIIASPFRPAV